MIRERILPGAGLTSARARRTGRWPTQTRPSGWNRRWPRRTGSGARCSRGRVSRSRPGLRAEGLAVLYRRGVDAIAKRDYEAGIADLERVIRQAPNDAEAHTWCAKAHYLRSDFPKAVKEYTEAIALAPNDKESYNNRGMASFRMGAHDSAIADFDQAIGLDGKFSDAYLNRGTVRLALGDAERAAQDFTKVLELEPRGAGEAYRLRSVAYASMGWANQAASDRRNAERLER